jgi:hypothetical protein
MPSWDRGATSHHWSREARRLAIPCA